MGVVSTPPLTPPASPERLMPTRDPSRPFLCGINGSTSAESFTSCRHRRRVIGHQQPEKLLSYVIPWQCLIKSGYLFPCILFSQSLNLIHFPVVQRLQLSLKFKNQLQTQLEFFLTNHCCPQRQEYRPESVPKTWGTRPIMERQDNDPVSTDDSDVDPFTLNLCQKWHIYTWRSRA